MRNSDLKTFDDTHPDRHLYHRPTNKKVVLNAELQADIMRQQYATKKLGRHGMNTQHRSRGFGQRHHKIHNQPS